MRCIRTVVLVLLCCGCGQKQDDMSEVGKVTPDDVFRCIAGLETPAPVPDGVKDLQVERDHSTDIFHLVVDRQQGLVYAVGGGFVH